MAFVLLLWLLCAVSEHACLVYCNDNAASDLYVYGAGSEVYAAYCSVDATPTITLSPSLSAFWNSRIFFCCFYCGRIMKKYIIAKIATIIMSIPMPPPCCAASAASTVVIIVVFSF